MYFSQAITADDFAMKKNPKYVNKVVAPTLEPISSIGGFRTLPDYSFDTMPDDYVALVLVLLSKALKVPSVYVGIQRRKSGRVSGRAAM